MACGTHQGSGPEYAAASRMHYIPTMHCMQHQHRPAATGQELSKLEQGLRTSDHGASPDMLIAIRCEWRRRRGNQRL